MRTWRTVLAVSARFCHSACLTWTDACRAAGWVTGNNQPYAGHLDGDSIDRHALAPGRPNVLIEVRNDLIADEAGQREWAARLAPVIARLLESNGL